MDELFNIGQQEEDQELADEAMRNTYRFVLSGYDWDKLPEKCGKLKNILDSKKK